MSVPAHTGFGLSTSDVKRRHILGKSLLVGLVAGGLASAFRLALMQAEQFRLAHADQGMAVAAIAIAIATLGGGIAVWLVRRLAPEASGSGIPHLKAVVLGRTTFRWRALLPVKFFAGLIAIGGGFALGREGPTVQMGGATGFGVAEALRVKAGEGERKALVSAGAGAGLAAAFNAPLSGMVFVLEELHGVLTPVVFVASFLASVVADVVARVLTGNMPVFILPPIAPPSLTVLPLAALLGVLLGFAGVAFNRGLLASVAFFGRIRRLPPFLVGAAVGLCVGAIGVFWPELVGSGFSIAERALTGNLGLAWLPCLFLARFALTLVCYGSGAAGGIFGPLLVLGSLAGLGVGLIGHAVLPTWIPEPAFFAVLGMGALLAAVVRAPLTGIVLMVELTGQYNIMLPLLTACLCAYGVAEALGEKPIYEALLDRSFGPAPAGQTGAAPGP